MVRRSANRSASRWLGLTMALAVATLASAPNAAQAEPVPDPFFFPTGDAEQDLNPSRLPGVQIKVDNARFPNSPTSDVAQSLFITNDGRITGWNIKDVRLAYNPATDRLGVGVNFFSIAGDVDGDGDPGVADSRTLAAGGVDLPNLSGRESITVAFDTNRDGTPDILAGVPANKTGSGIDAFTVSSYQPAAGTVQPGIERSYGSPLPQFAGNLAYNPSSQHPDFEFTLNNFTQLTGLTFDSNQTAQFNVRVYAGTPDDVVAGEDLFLDEFQITVPVPTTLPLWACLAGFAAWRRRVRSRSSQDAASTEG